MALNQVRGLKTRSPTKEQEIEDYRTPRLKFQQASFIIKEQEKYDEFVGDVAEQVVVHFDNLKLNGEKVSKAANKKWKQVLQINLIKEDGSLAPTKLEFTTDTAYYEWFDNGGADRDLKEGNEYTVIRVIV